MDPWFLLVEALECLSESLSHCVSSASKSAHNWQKTAARFKIKNINCDVLKFVIDNKPLL